METRIREIRAERGWTVRRLAEKSGVDKNTISEVERGKRKPNPITMHKLAESLGVEVQDLFPLERPRQHDPRVEVAGAFFVPVDEGEEQTVHFHFVRLFEEGEPVLQAMREASPAEAAKIREQLEKAGRESV